MRLLVTRPREDAVALAHVLEAAGHDVLIQPLLEIVPREAQPTLTDIQALLFTSANGVRAFAERIRERELPVYAVGDATARAAREAGFGEVHSAAGDVDALAAKVRDELLPEQGALLHGAGGDTAGDLAGTLAAFGFRVERAVLYDAIAATAFAPEVKAALSDRKLDAALFFSPRTARAFVTLAGQEGLAESCRHLDALCLSRAVADAASPLPWRAVRVADRPEQAALLAELDALMAAKSPSAASAIPGVASNSAEKSPTEKSPTEKSSTDTSSAGTSAQTATGAKAGGRGRGVAWTIFAATLLAIFVIGFLSALALAPQLEEYWPGRTAAKPSAALDNKLDTLVAKIGGLERRITTSEPVAAGDPNPAAALGATAVDADALSALRAELGELRAALLATKSDADVTDLAARVGSLEAQLKTLPADSSASIAPLAARVAVAERAQEEMRVAAARLPALDASLARLNEDMTAQRTRLDETAAKLDGVVERLTRLDRGALPLLFAAGQLRDGVRAGAPFADELAAVRPRLRDQPALTEALAILDKEAGAGVAPLARLQASFAPVASAIVRAAEREAAQGWFDQTLARLKSVVTVRRVGDVAGEAADARVARAEVALAAGDLARAVAELSALTGAARTAASPWLVQGETRLAAERAAALVYRHAVAALTGETAGR